MAERREAFGFPTATIRTRAIGWSLLLYGLVGHSGFITATHAADWPQFRGPRGDGVAAASPTIPTVWNAFRNIGWQTELPGRGWSSPVVIGDRIWLTAAEAQALDDETRAKKVAASKYKEYQFQIYSQTTLFALEVDAKSGRLLRRIPVLTVADPVPIHASNSYASPTPVTDGERLYCHFGSLGTVAIDLATGEKVWQQRFDIDEITGPGSSPILWHDLLIFPCDGTDAQFVVALDRRTGREKWRTPRPSIDAPDARHRRAFSTPLLVRHGDVEQLIIPGAQWVVAYSPNDGREIWRVKYGDGHATVPCPVARQGIVYICTGYMKPRLVAIRVDGQGDVTTSHVAWSWDKQVPELSSPIIVGDEIYFVSALGIVTCLNAETGQQQWQHRLGGNFSSSPLAVGERIYFTSEEGTTTIVQAGRTYEQIAQNQLVPLVRASPAVCDGGLLLRTSESLYFLKGRVPK